MQSPQLSPGWVCLLQTLQATPQSFVCPPNVRLSREEQPQENSLVFLAGAVGEGKRQGWGSDVGVLCQGSSLSWVKPHSELCLALLTPTAWPGKILVIDPGSGLEPKTLKPHNWHSPGEQTQGRQRVLSGCAGVCCGFPSS